MGWPQIAMMVIFAIWIISDIAILNGWRPQAPGRGMTGFRILFRPLLFTVLLSAGGFF